VRNKTSVRQAGIKTFDHRLPAARPTASCWAVAALNTDRASTS
jgi:hypothetical protein